MAEGPEDTAERATLAENNTFDGRIVGMASVNSPRYSSSIR